MSRSAYAAFQAEAAQEEATYAHPSAHVRFLTKEGDIFGPCGDFEDLKFQDKDRQAGGLSFRVPDTEPWREYFYGQSKYATRPILIGLPGYETLWFTVAFGRIREGRKKWIQVDAVHALEHFNWIRIWPDAFFPPEFQPSKESVGLGGACTVLKSQLQPNLMRLQGSYWSVPPGNLFDLATWDLLGRSFWPMVVNPRRTGFWDTSPWAITSARMDKYMDIVQEVCNMHNLTPVIDYFIPGEHEQPFPEFATLTRPTMVVDFIDQGNKLEFTGTFVDGLIRTARDMADDAIEWITYPVLGHEGADDEWDGLTANGRPIPVYRTGQYATVGRFEQVTHIPMATRATGGGKSPTWVNDLMVNTANFLLGWLGAAIGLPGLSLGVLTDRLKNTVLAFHSMENHGLATEAGPLRFKETFAASEATGLSLNVFASMVSSLWEVRGYESALIEVTNGAPYWIGKDISKGIPVGVEREDGRIEVQHVREIHFEQSRKTGGKGRYLLQIGEGEAEREPGSIALGKIRKLFSTVTRVALGG